MATETYAKNGQVSKKDHGGRGKPSKEWYSQGKFDPTPAMGDGPDSYERSMSSTYRKNSLPSSE